MYIYMYAYVCVCMQVCIMCVGMHVFACMYVILFLGYFLSSIVLKRQMDPNMCTKSLTWPLLIERQHPGLKGILLLFHA